MTHSSYSPMPSGRFFFYLPALSPISRLGLCVLFFSSSRISALVETLIKSSSSIQNHFSFQFFSVVFFFCCFCIFSFFLFLPLSFSFYLQQNLILITQFVEAFSISFCFLGCFWCSVMLLCLLFLLSG